ncbi:MAG: DUF1565 domain-containing protein, partial [Deltaproteobacteria bacterium]|nr:DUF1565 domain-containing protein [Deltaproteobacteria bacterium]
MRQVFSRLTAMGVVAAMALACSGPQEEKDVVPGDVTVEVVAADATSCPSGLVPWPGGGCAPRIDDCPNPWELPLIGGGCLPIGPRACPKTWNPEAEVDCEVGTLMEYDGNACPEGFVLTEDEVACIPFFEENCGEMEIPVLGGGCKKVGPDWYDPEAPYGGLDVPYFDECGPGLLALEGGGCVQVGPRACPKLWDPESVVDCEVGDVLPCPDGWSESEDGMYCDPKYGECGPGERSLVGGGCERVVPLAKDCPPGPFPEVPEGAKDVVYVSAASTCTEGCGSEGAPFKTITAALEAVPDGGYVLVGAGEYEEGVLIQKPVRLMGICAPLVRVSGSVPLLGANVQDMESAGILVSGGNSVGLSRLGVTPANAGIVLLDASGAQLESIEITGGEGPGLYLGGGSAASAGGLWVSDTHYGVLVSKGASLELHEALVDSVFLLGIRAMGTQAQISLSGTTIRATRPDAAGQYGYGIGMSGGSSGTVEGCLLDGNTGEGVLLSDDKTKLAISTSVIRGTAADKDGSYGHAIEAMYGAEVTVSGSLLDANAARGVVVWDSGTQVTLAQTTLSGTVGSKGGNGIGLKVQHGGALNAVGCLLEGNSGVGAHATGQQSSLQLVGTAIRKTQPQLNGQYGNALQVDNGAMVGVVLSLFEANTSAGMVLWHSGTKVMLDNTVVQDTVPDSIGMVGGVGVQVRKGASLEMSESLVVGNSAVGVQAGEVGSRAELTRSEVRGTKTTAGGMVGYGG